MKTTASQPALQDLLSCSVTADTLVFASSPQAHRHSAGAARELVLRGPHSWVLLQFDLSALKGRAVDRAVLHVHRRQFHLLRVGLSTIATQYAWAEGDADRPEEKIGAACFRAAVLAPTPQETRDWGAPGSTLADVTFGRGGSRWVPAIPRFEPETGWFEIDVPKEFVQSMALGLQAPSLVLTDDFNRDEAFASIDSRESEFPPRLEVRARPAPDLQSAPPSGLRAWRDGLGREWVEFSAPDAIGLDIVLARGRGGDPRADDGTVRLPVYELPTPAGGPMRVLLSRQRRVEHTVARIRTREFGGQWSAAQTVELPAVVSAGPALTLPTLRRYELPEQADRPFTLDAGPSLSEDGRWIRNAARTWWNPFEGPIALESARNEFTSFQVVLAGGAAEYAVVLTDWESPAATAPGVLSRFYLEQHVLSRLGQQKWCPDPLVPIDNGQRMRLELERAQATASAPAGAPASSPGAAASSEPVRHRRVQPVWVDLYVPHGAAAGVWRSRLIVLRDGQALLDIPVELNVLAADLPDELHYPVLLCSRGLPGRAHDSALDAQPDWELFRAYHRLAHEHRVTYAPIPYDTTGHIHAGFAPDVSGDGGELRLDWRAWDERFATLLDGGLFRDLPRRGQPLRHMVLPIHENWPFPLRPRHATRQTPLFQQYHSQPIRTELVRSLRPNPLPEACLTWPLELNSRGEYIAGMRAARERFEEHFKARGWTRTELDALFCNGPSGAANESWWLLREPQVLDDILGLEFLLNCVLGEDSAKPTHRLTAASQAVGNTRRIAWLGDVAVARDRLQHDAEVVVLNDSLRRDPDVILTRPDLYPEVWTNPRQTEPEMGWASVLADAWADRLAGAEGTIVSEAVGTTAALEKASTQAWMAPSSPDPAASPLASGRLKTLRRVQEDMEWLAEYIRRAGRKGTPAGYALASIAQQLFERQTVQAARQGTLLPAVHFPGRLDTVSFEELRRGLRAAVAAPDHP